MTANGLEYQEKPTLYLDQNVLDLFIGGGFRELFEKLKSTTQIVYSDETLKEIKRSGEFSDKFLSVLKEFDAYYLKLVLDQPGFTETDKVMITNSDPYNAFEEFCENTQEFDYVQLAMEQSIFKYSGGRTGEGISDIHDEQKKMFSKLMIYLKGKLAEVSDEFPDINGLFNEYMENIQLQFEKSLDESEDMMKEHIADDKNWSGIKEFRNTAGIGPKELNNIKPPDVIKKIWEEISNLPPYNTKKITIEEFLGLTNNPISPEADYFKHQKVIGLYNILNTLGYYPDSDVHKERRFVASLSDNSHASMASFCDLLFSRDKPFVKKVSAIYEYLEIPTLVRLVKISENE